jgi:hypothetical protein
LCGKEQQLFGELQRMGSRAITKELELLQAEVQSRGHEALVRALTANPEQRSENENRTRLWKNGAKRLGKTAFAALYFEANGRGLKRWPA